MNRWTLVWLIGIFGLAGCGNDAVIEEAATRHEAFSLTHNGIQRTYVVYAPKRCGASCPTPVVITLHGGGGTAEGWPEYTNSGFEKLADQTPFILVYPEGLQGQWNDKRTISRSYAHSNDIDDVGFISALIDQIIETYPVDKRRVYVTGSSNGGMMAHYLASELSGKIAAIASVIASIPVNLANELRPQRPLSVLMINGTDDPLVRWDGGVVTLGKNECDSVISVEASVDFWSRHNRCSETPLTVELPDRAPDDGTTAVRYDYMGGADETEVVLYKIKGGGHTWPAYEDKRRPLMRRVADGIVGKRSRDIDACEVIWYFFSKHTLPQ